MAIVAVGTAVADLTGIVVTAHYSDGSTVTVTDYTLSGEIAEGSNTITVSYGGKTTTFTVTGVAESSGEEVTLPEGVTLVAYLETDGASYIDTGYNVAATDMLYLNCDWGGTSTWSAVMGAFDTHTLRFFLAFNGLMRHAANSSEAEKTYSISGGDRPTIGSVEDITLKVQKATTNNYQRYTVYDSSGAETLSGGFANAGELWDMTQPWYLFACNNNGVAADHVKAGFKIRGFKITDIDGNVLRNYVPVTDAEGVACMYETKQGTYHYNQGTGAFIVGEVA